MATTRLGLGGPSAAYAGFTAKDALVVVIAQTGVSVRALRTSAVAISASRQSAVSVRADRTTAVQVQIGVE